MVKNFGSKKVWQKDCFARLAKKTLVNVDLHRQSKINSKTKQFQTIVPLAWLDHFWRMQGVIACNISAQTK